MSWTERFQSWPVPSCDVTTVAPLPLAQLSGGMREFFSAVANTYEALYRILTLLDPLSQSPFLSALALF